MRSHSPSPQLKSTFLRSLARVVLLTMVATATLAYAEDLITDVRRETRTDTVEEKLSLLQDAYSSGRFDLALSLSESIKDTLQCEEQLHAQPAEPILRVDNTRLVTDLPTAWARWALGWKYVECLKVTEPSGIDRVQEPVDLPLAFPLDDTTDLHREIRVARLDAASGELREVPSQVYNFRRRADARHCRLVFFVDVPAEGKAHYFLFHGNPWAELSNYESDLQVDGEKYGLDITNQHFTALLSRQTGQLERLRYARQHGLELYAGGKGHGEPPTIDWSNDYVDQEHYQKNRIRNWAEPPNYEVVRGPLVVRVRRWGFPHSPIHPVFTPSRMHVDQTYVFYAGKDYFLKEGTMEAVKDFELATMRDDEWVLSGYSFTEKLWLDSNGHLREGDVLPNALKSMQGVGFYHEHSRDAFVALWLEHSITGDNALERNGVPTLHYPHHGQLWSRYPLGSESLQLKKGDKLQQRNAYLVAPFPETGADKQISSLRQRLLEPVVVEPTMAIQPDNATAIGALAREGESPAAATLKSAVWQALNLVRDEQFYHIDGNLVDIGLIYDVKVRDGRVEIVMTMPHRGRPVYQFFVFQGGGRITEGIRERVLKIDGVQDVNVKFTWYPAWTIDRLTTAGRRSFGLEP